MANYILMGSRNIESTDGDIYIPFYIGTISCTQEVVDEIVNEYTFRENIIKRTLMMLVNDFREKSHAIYMSICEKYQTPVSLEIDSIRLILTASRKTTNKTDDEINALVVRIRELYDINGLAINEIYLPLLETLKVEMAKKKIEDFSFIENEVLKNILVNVEELVELFYEEEQILNK